MRAMVLAMMLSGCENKIICGDAMTPDLAISDKAETVDLAPYLDLGIEGDIALETDLARAPDISGPTITKLKITGRPIKVMTIGDSNTVGISGVTESAYREEFYNQATAHGYSVEMVGAFAQGSFSQNHHDGRNGWDAQTYNLIIDPSTNRHSNFSNFVAAQAPDVLWIETPVNDCYAGDSSLGGYEETAVAELVGTLVRQVSVRFPDMLIFVASVTPLYPTGRVNPTAVSCVAQENARLPLIVDFLRTNGAKAYFVDMGLVLADVGHFPDSGGWTGSLGGDGVHLNTIGEIHYGDRMDTAFETYVSP